VINEIIKELRQVAAEGGCFAGDVLVPAIFFDAHCAENNIIPEACMFFGPTVRFRWDESFWIVRAAPMESGQ